MESKSLEARVKSLEAELQALKKKFEERERDVRTLKDIEEIKRLQCAYGYYLERWMSDEIIACFANRPDVSATLVEGTYKGPEGIRRYFGKSRAMPPEFLHLVMQVSPVITVSPDGMTAKGRWYGWGTILFRPTQPLDPTYMCVIYEMDYIKEDGVWKIWHLRLNMHYAYNSGRAPAGPPDEPGMRVKLSPDEWAPYDTQYPSGYIYPFHFPHPVTGKPTSEHERNAVLKLKPNPFRSWGEEPKKV
ncbi:MAG: nuclear transport factor 2 family protein [Dehalococcoidales bacterium]|nr:nuclear transport factor 2 family protein [Dehalococcoidales bacterium]